MDEPALQGCLIKRRLSGVIEGEQGEGKKKERKDRLVAIEEIITNLPSSNILTISVKSLSRK
jgi:hypothetical protein